jgi:hypothetical protein
MAAAIVLIILLVGAAAGVALFFLRPKLCVGADASA